MKIGRYEIDREISRDHLGAVVEVRDSSGPMYGRLIDRENIADESALMALMRHLAAAAGPGLVRIADVAHDDRQWLLVTEPAGQRLTDVLAGRQLGGAGAIAILDDTASGLLQLHRWNSAHGAVGSSTVCVDGDGVARLADAGLAALLGGPTDLNADFAAWAELAETLTGRCAIDGPAGQAVQRAANHAGAGDLTAARAELTEHAQRAPLVPPATSPPDASIDATVMDLPITAGAAPPADATVMDLPVATGSTPPVDATVMDLPVTSGTTPPVDATVMDLPITAASTPSVDATVMDAPITTGSTPPVDATIMDLPVAAGSTPPAESNAIHLQVTAPAASTDMGATLLDVPDKSSPAPIVALGVATGAASAAAAVSAPASSADSAADPSVVSFGSGPRIAAVGAITATADATTPSAKTPERPKHRLLKLLILAALVAAGIVIALRLLQKPAGVTIGSTTLSASRPSVRCNIPVDIIAKVSTTGSGDITFRWELPDGTAIAGTQTLTISSSQPTTTITLHDHVTGTGSQDRRVVLHILTPTSVVSSPASYTYSCR